MTTAADLIAQALKASGVTGVGQPGAAELPTPWSTSTRCSRSGAVSAGWSSTWSTRP